MDKSASYKDTEPTINSPRGSLISLQKIEESTYWQVAIFVALAIFIAAAIYVYLWLGQESFVREETKSNETSQTQNANLTSTKTKSSQDQQRKNDIEKINGALKSYFVSNKKAPDTLGELIPSILAELPTDPLTKKGYNYKRAADGQSWQISAILSNGTTFEDKGP
jgi:hypothetical protein